MEKINQNGVLKYLKFIFITLHLQKLPILGLCILTLASYCSGVIFAFISKEVIDKVFVSKDLNYLLKIVPLIVFAYVLYCALDVLTTYLVVRWKVNIDFALKCQFFRRMNMVDYEKLSIISSAELYYRMFTDGSALSRYFYTLCITIPVNTLFCVIVFVLMLRWSWQLTCFTLILIITQFINLYLFRKPVETINLKQRRIDQAVSSFVLEKLGLIEFAKTLGIDEWWNTEVENKFDNAKRVTVNNTYLISVFNNISSLVQQFWTLGLLVLGAFLIFDNQITIGLFFGFQAIINYFISPFSSVISGILSYQDAKVAFNRYMEYYELPEMLQGKNFLFTFKDAFNFNHLSFAYGSNNKTIIEDLSCSFGPNTIVAIVGSSGSGKTTLMKLASRLIQTKKGNITIDDVDIIDISFESYIQHVGFMLQRSIVFNDTLKNNLTLGRDISDEDIDDIIEKCYLSKVVEHLPDKLDTILGDNGIELSVGESQRLALARIMLGKPKILWLDEPTAALDKESEELIVRALIQYKNDEHALIFINTHRSLILDYVDYVIKL